MLFKLTLLASLILNHFHRTLQEEPPKDLISTVKLPNGIKKGQTAITIYGSSPKNSKRFTINLQEGSEWYEGDIGLHMSVRFSQGTVVFNTFANKRWKDETVFQGIPFKAGQVFTITIRLGEDNYQIFMKGNHLGDYPYDVPLEKLTHLIVEGKVDVREIFFKGKLVEDSGNGHSDSSNNVSNEEITEKVNLQEDTQEEPKDVNVDIPTANIPNVLTGNCSVITIDGNIDVQLPNTDVHLPNNLNIDAVKGSKDINAPGKADNIPNVPNGNYPDSTINAEIDYKKPDIQPPNMAIRANGNVGF